MCSKAVASVLLFLTSSTTAMPPPPSTLYDADQDFLHLPSSSLFGTNEDQPQMHSPSPFPLSDANDNALPPQHSHSTMHPLQELSPGNNLPLSPDVKESVINVDSQAKVQYIPPQSEEERHPEVPNADFLSSFLNLVEPEQSPPVVLNKAFNGDPSDPSKTLADTLKGLLESNLVPVPQLESNLVEAVPQLKSNLVPVPQMEPRSDPVTLTSTLWATIIAIVTFILRKKMMFFAAFGAVIATILGITFGISSLSSQGKSAEDRQDTLEMMLSQEGLAGIIFNIQALWGRLLELLSIPTEVLLAGEQAAGSAQDRSDLNVSAVPQVLTKAPASLSSSKPVDSEVAEAVQHAAEVVADAAQRAAEEAVEEVQHAGDEAAEAVQHAAEEVAEAVQRTAEGAAEAVQRTSEEAAETVQHTAEEAAEAVQHAAEEVQHAAEEAAKEVQRTGEDVQRTVETAAEAVQHAAEEAVEEVQHKGEEVAEAVQRKAAEAAEAVQRSSEEAAETVQHTAEEAVEAVQHTAEEAVEAVQHRIENVAEAVQHTGEEVQGASEEAVEALKRTAEDVAEAVRHAALQLESDSTEAAEEFRAAENQTVS